MVHWVKLYIIQLVWNFRSVEVPIFILYCGFLIPMMYILSPIWCIPNSYDVCINFVDSVIKKHFPDLSEDHTHFNLITTYQVHSHSKSCRKYKNQKYCYNFGKHFTNILLFYFYRKYEKLFFISETRKCFIQS